MTMDNEAFRQLLADCQIHPSRGFLPARDPGSTLAGYAPWEDACAQISALINAGALRAHIDRMPQLPVDALEDGDDLERAMLLLSFLGHGYLRERDDGCDVLPAQLAVPWWQVARRLGRPPVLSHGSVVLRNWRRIDPEGPVALGNLATLFQFHGGVDEAWFYLVTVEIEAVGARGVLHLARAAAASSQGKDEQVLRGLEGACEAMEAMSGTLLRITERCDPYIFYHRVRPFLGSIENVRYADASPDPQSYHGGSAAQSALLQTYDRALGVRHEEEPSREYTRNMLRFMPVPHRDFIAWMDSMDLQACCAGSKVLSEARRACLEAMTAFRQHHLEIVARYVMAQARDQATERGTGGTSPMTFLKQMKQDTSG